MPDSSRTRILLLILAGALLIGGVNVWQNAQIAKQEEITDQMPTKLKRPKLRPVLTRDKANATDFKVGAAEPLRPSVAGAEQVSPTTATPGQAAPMLPAVPTKIVATGRTEAEGVARKAAGRPDPFLGVTGYKPFPSRGISLDEEARKSEPTSKSKRLLVPPPPPVVHTYAPPALPSAEMPEPPSRPMLSHKVRLVAVLADRAVLKITDKRLRQDNKWPSTITLGSGDKFESLEVVRVAPDSVTIEEDGERSVKTLERIR
jgi:hypothetical protein